MQLAPLRWVLTYRWQGRKRRVIAEQQEYDFRVGRLIPASVAAFACVVLISFCAPLAKAQTHGTSGTTSFTGFGGNPDQMHRIYTGATPLGPMGYTGTNQSLNHPHCCIPPANPHPPQQTGWHYPNHPNRSHRPSFPVGGAVYAVPYPVYLTDADGDDSAAQPESDAAKDGPGPTIFDRGGSNLPGSAAESAYAERMTERMAEKAAQKTNGEPQAEPAAQSSVAPADDADPVPVAEQPQTILVFKDKRLLEVRNYAIVGDMLYDMTPGRRSKIAIADLDLTATARENDDRGIDFQLPVRPATN
jgi:hypothetical protein